MTLDTYVLGSGCIKPSRSHGMLLAIRLVIVGTDYRDGEATSLLENNLSTRRTITAQATELFRVLLLFYFSVILLF